MANRKMEDEISRNELSNYIRSVFDTSAEHSEKIATYFKTEQLPRNSYHTHYGDRFGKLSFVKSGYLRIYKQAENKEVTQWVSSPGEFTADLGTLLFEQPARFSIQAITDCELFTIDYADYQSIHEVIENWDQLEKLFLGKCFLTLEERVFNFIALSAEERYEYLNLAKPELFSHVPQQFIASMLGMTPETFSRIRKKRIS